MEKLKASEINEQTIAQWKAQHKTVFCYKSEDGKVAYFRSPSRIEIEAAQSMSAKPMTSNAILAKNAFLGGDVEILEDDKYFYGLTEHLKDIIKKVSGELVEL